VETNADAPAVSTAIGSPGADGARDPGVTSLQGASYWKSEAMLSLGEALALFDTNNGLDSESSLDVISSREQLVFDGPDPEDRYDPVSPGSPASQPSDLDEGTTWSINDLDGRPRPSTDLNSSRDRHRPDIHLVYAQKLVDNYVPDPFPPVSAWTFHGLRQGSFPFLTPSFH